MAALGRVDVRTSRGCGSGGGFVGMAALGRVEILSRSAKGLGDEYSTAANLGALLPQGVAGNKKP
jgi:hypothetical protein